MDKPINDPHLKLDIYYNISRLLFHVYNQFFLADGVHISDLVNVDEVLVSTQSVVQDLPTIVKHHESTIDLSIQLSLKPLIDLLYNTGIAYTQVLEDYKDKDSAFEMIYEYGLKTQQIFQQLLDQQVAQLQQFVAELDGINTETSEAPADRVETPGDKPDSQNAVGEEVLQPSDVFDTIISGYKVSHALLENVNEPATEIPRIRDLINPFLYTCDTIATQLVDSFGETTNSKPDLLQSVSSQQWDEYKLNKAYTNALMIDELEELVSFWESNSSELHEQPEKYLAIVDSVQEFLDRHDINLITCNASDQPQMIEGFWRALTLMTNNLKKYQELMTTKKTEQQKTGGDNLGTLIAQMSNVIIYRADIDLQRCQLNHEQGIKNRDLLLQNCKVFLKNAMNLANSSGGLREKASEKLARNQKKVEAVARLCVLENKTTIEELENILGRKLWQRELPNLKKLEYFDQFTSNL